MSATRASALNPETPFAFREVVAKYDSRSTSDGKILNLVEQTRDVSISVLVAFSQSRIDRSVLFFLYSLNEFDRRFLDVIMLVLPRSVSCGQKSATVDIFEIAVGEFVSGLRIFGVSVVDS